MQMQNVGGNFSNFPFLTTNSHFQTLAKVVRLTHIYIPGVRLTHIYVPSVRLTHIYVPIKQLITRI